MNTNTIFSPLFAMLSGAASLVRPPQWLIAELQNRMVLFLNHVLQQQSASRDILLQQRGKIIGLRWREFALDLQITPAGMFELAPSDSKLDLSLHIMDESPRQLLAAMQQGDKPNLHIEGDVNLARDVNLVIETIRWDFEDDLARLVGDAPAHLLTTVGKNAAAMLRKFVDLLPKAGRVDK